MVKMKRRQAFIIICLFGVASVIVLSVSRSASLTFITHRNLWLTDEYPNWSHQLINLMSYEKLKMNVSDIYDSNVALSSERMEKKARRCPNILSGMVKGEWITRTLTQHEQEAIDEYLRKERGIYQIPPSYQRNDGRCGDIAYEKSPIVRHMMFKSICNPKGETPCCYTNKCINASEADCRCPTCYDERQSIHAEYAQWKTEDDRCEVKNFTALEACTVLNGTTLHFVGDSFIRHVFAAMIILLTNNPEGAVKESTAQYYRDKCKGMHQITGFPCRDYIEKNRSVCNGTVQVVYTEVFPAKDLSLALPFLHKLPHVKKSMVVLGLGIHDNFNVKTVSEQFLLPLFSLHQALATNNTSKVNLENVKPSAGNLGTASWMFNIGNTAFDNRLYRALLPFSMNYTQDNYSFRGQMNQLKSYLSFLKETTTKQVFSTTSPSDMHRNQQTTQPNDPKTANTSRNNLEVIDSRERKNYTDVGRLTNLPNPINLDFRRSDNVKVDNLVVSNLSRVRRNAETGNSSPPNISQTSPSSADIKPWPRLLWIGAHSPGLLKSPKFSQQTAAGVQSFNKNIYELLNDFKVPYLDTFEFTKGIVSFDGTHYGWGINMLKANMLLTYIEHELANDPDWR